MRGRIGGEGGYFYNFWRDEKHVQVVLDPSIDSSCNAAANSEKNLKAVMDVLLQGDLAQMHSRKLPDGLPRMDNGGRLRLAAPARSGLRQDVGVARLGAPARGAW